MPGNNDSDSNLHWLDWLHFLRSVIAAAPGLALLVVCFTLAVLCCLIWISFAQLLLNALGEERVGPSGQRNLHPLRLIEQISYEQLLPVKMTPSHFITADKRSDSICMLQLSAILRLARSCFQYIMTNIITSTSLFMDSTNRQTHRACQVSINYNHGPAVSASTGLLGLCWALQIFRTTQVESLLSFIFLCSFFLLIAAADQVWWLNPDLPLSLPAGRDVRSSESPPVAERRNLLWRCPL